MARARRGHLFHAAAIAVFVLLVGLAATPATASPSAGDSTCGLTASITLDPTSGDPGTPVLVTGAGFCTGTTVAIKFIDVDGVKWPLVNKTPVAGDGSISVNIVIPRDVAIGDGNVKASDAASKQCPYAYFEVTAPG